jgi:hypothetical protein
MKPLRVQLRRTKGWRMPENTVSVARPTMFGNRYRVGVHGTAEQCVAKYRADLEDVLGGPVGLHRALIMTLLSKVRGKNLACWCPLDRPCHADTLLELVNALTPPSP